MIDVAHSVTVHRPVEEVYRFLANFENWPRWRTGLHEAHRVSQGTDGVGEVWEMAGEALGRPLAMTLEVTDYEENKLFGFKSTAGPIIAESRLVLEPVAEGTRVSYLSNADVSGFVRLAQPLLNWQAQRSWEKDLYLLKRLLEESAKEGK